MILIMTMIAVIAMIVENKCSHNKFHHDHDQRPECDIVKLAGWHVTLRPIVRKLWPTEAVNSVIMIIIIITIMIVIIFMLHSAP